MADDVPERLKQRGRSPDPNFRPAEDLYRRVIRRDHIGDDGYVKPAGVPFPDLSVNRGKYSEPEDVLIGHEGVVAIAVARVGDIPEREALDDPNDSRVYEFHVVHDPEPQNYSHSEIRSFLDGEHVTRKPPKTVRTRFRLAFGLKVLKRL